MFFAYSILLFSQKQARVPRGDSSPPSGIKAATTVSGRMPVQFKDISIIFQANTPNPITVGTIKRSRSDSLSSTETYQEELEHEAIECAAKTLRADKDHLVVSEILTSCAPGTTPILVEAVTGILVAQLPGTLPVCPPCSALKNEIHQTRDRALLRQAAANAISILKRTLYKHLPSHVQETYLVSEYVRDVDWGRVKWSSLNRLFEALAAPGKAAFLAEVGMASYQELWEFNASANRLKDLFNSDAHPVEHYSGSVPTRESLLRALSSLDLDANTELGGQALLEWLSQNRSGQNILFNRDSQV